MPPPSLDEFWRQLHDLETALPHALASAAYAISVLPRLEEAELSFGVLVNRPEARSDFTDMYRRLDLVIRSTHERYKKISENCDSPAPSTPIQNCTQARLVQRGSGASLAWLNLEAASSPYFDDPKHAKTLLAEAAALFTSLAGVAEDSDRERECLLGRAFTERELGRYDKIEFNRAISDFEIILKDGRETRQFRAAQQGCATAYFAMGAPGTYCAGDPRRANSRSSGRR